VLAALPRLTGLEDRLAFLHLTGEADRERVDAGYREHGFAHEVAAFTQEMPALMRRAHLVVCRAGASTLAELAAVGRAAILVPYPFAANNHQEFNARFLTAAGAGEIILNKDFTAETFAGKINQFLTEPEHLANLEPPAANWPSAPKNCRGLELMAKPRYVMCKRYEFGLFGIIVDEKRQSPH
jgi:UDP-N-acetylglucosamine--N-acetylmuramyl-(pentapeptide) pyrophosphoryl-undecaprenol N-acetylglucosamine transferase